jgi:serine/threonine protein kinase
MIDFINGGNLANINVFDFMSQISEALKFLHEKKIIFRDLKFENILVKTNPNYTYGYQFLLTDFGLSKKTNKTENTNFIGTVSYFAPE